MSTTWTSPRRRAAAMLAVAVVLVSLVGVAPAAAQNLEDRRAQVERRIEQNAAQLEDSSARVVAAVGGALRGAGTCPIHRMGLDLVSRLRAHRSPCRLRAYPRTNELLHTY